MFDDVITSREDAFTLAELGPRLFDWKHSSSLLWQLRPRLFTTSERGGLKKEKWMHHESVNAFRCDKNLQKLLQRKEFIYLFT
jgi:hypothetical protein